MDDELLQMKAINAIPMTYKSNINKWKKSFTCDTLTNIARHNQMDLNAHRHILFDG